MYSSVELTRNPDSLLAASKLGNPAPTALKRAVIAIVVVRIINQNVKNELAEAVNPTIK